MKPVHKAVRERLIYSVRCHRALREKLYDKELIRERMLTGAAITVALRNYLSFKDIPALLTPHF